MADTVVTEYGIARLLNRSVRERAEALIAIAHRTSAPSRGRRRGGCSGRDQRSVLIRNLTPAGASTSTVSPRRRRPQQRRSAIRG
jgi:hypothetical protein